MRTVSFDLPSVTCFIHWPDKPFDFVTMELPFLPVIGMEFMDEFGNIHQVKRVIFHIDNKTADVYFEKEN